LVIARTPDTLPLVSEGSPPAACGMRNTGTIRPGPVILTWVTRASMSVFRWLSLPAAMIWSM